jgi:hypothetical protein
MFCLLILKMPWHPATKLVANYSARLSGCLHSWGSTLAASRFLLRRTKSAYGTKRTCLSRRSMSAFGNKADIASKCRFVRL